jgi:microcystin-dependent protein
MSGSLGSRYYTPNAFETDSTGVPYNGSQLFFYVTGTSTPLNTYQDVTLLTANPNPVVSDATGHYGNIFLSAVSGYKIVCYGPNPTPSVPSTPASPQGTLLWSADPCGPASGQASQNVAGIIGEVRDFAGPAASIPSQWYSCGGQAVSRTTYSAAFSVLGTTWGAGDGSTTFNLPDLRGRGTLGYDYQVNAAYAGRVTAGVGGINSQNVGAAGGSQNAQQDTITSTATTTVTDPGHTHTVSIPIASGATNGGSGGLTGNSPASVFTTSNSQTGVTVAVAVTSTSSLTGTSQNIPPMAVMVKIIYLGA